MVPVFLMAGLNIYSDYSKAPTHNFEPKRLMVWEYDFWADTNYMIYTLSYFGSIFLMLTAIYIDMWLKYFGYQQWIVDHLRAIV